MLRDVLESFGKQKSHLPPGYLKGTEDFGSSGRIPGTFCSGLAAWRSIHVQNPKP